MRGAEPHVRAMEIALRNAHQAAPELEQGDEQAAVLS